MDTRDDALDSPTDSQRLDVFCDGSISQAILVDPLNSAMSEEWIGRVMFVAPSIGIGAIQQYRDNLLTKEGNPDSTAIEVRAIQFTLRFCETLGQPFVCYSDCQGAVEKVNEPNRVEWQLRRKVLPNEYLDRVLGRAQYLRQSQGKIAFRRPVEPYQQEIFTLFNAESLSFQLADSPLWQRIQAQRSASSLKRGDD